MRLKGKGITLRDLVKELARDVVAKYVGMVHHGNPLVAASIYFQLSFAINSVNEEGLVEILDEIYDLYWAINFAIIKYEYEVKEE